MARLRRGSATLIRDLNRAAILGAVGRHGPISRADTASRLGLSPATVTAITRDLLADGLLAEVDQAPSRGGRPGILLALVGDAAQVVGLKVAANHVLGVRADLNGVELERFGGPIELGGDPAEAIALVLEAALARAATPDPNANGSAVPSRVLGIGLGVPGIVDQQRGTVRSPHLGWDALPLGPALQARLGVPVLIDNDVNTLAIAERLDGRGRDLEHFVTVTIGPGVGLGIVVGGEIYRGADGAAGEFGHVRVVEDGPACVCGRRGCLEAIVGDSALVRDARARGVELGTDDEAAVATLRVLADAGDGRARAIFAHAGETLGRAVGGLVAILGPQSVLLSGEGTQAWPLLEAAFREAYADGVLGGQPPRVEVDPWDDARWARGAAALVLQATFRSPIYEHAADELLRGRLVGDLTEIGAAELATAGLGAPGLGTAQAVAAGVDDGR